MSEIIDPAIILSVRVIEWLKTQGRSQRDIARLLGVGESFVSRLAAGKRCLTVDHLSRLEDRLGLSIPILLLEADLAWQTNPDKKTMLAEAISLLRASYALRSELPDEPSPVRAASKKAASTAKSRKPSRRKTVGAF